MSRVFGLQLADEDLELDSANLNTLGGIGIAGDVHASSRADADSITIDGVDTLSNLSTRTALSSPTITDFTNCVSATPATSSCQYMRIGGMVIMQGELSGFDNNTTIGSEASVQLNLPIAIGAADFVGSYGTWATDGGATNVIMAAAGKGSTSSKVKFSWITQAATGACTITFTIFYFV